MIAKNVNTIIPGMTVTGTGVSSATTETVIVKSVLLLQTLLLEQFLT